MATARERDVEPSLTECPVCHDTFTVPKLLPCSHILCRQCLVTWLQSQPQAACPICRCAIVDPVKQEGQSVEEVADGFPTDLAMTAMVEAETLLSKQHVCCVCDNVAAVALCLQCRDLFCQHCSSVHRKQAVTKHHEVEELSTLTTERLAAHHPTTCPNHSEELSKVYCPTHDTTLCMLCATTAHRSCPQLDSLQIRIDGLTAELFQLHENLAAAVASADQQVYLLDKHVQDIQRDEQAALNELKPHFERLKADIDARFLELQKAASNIVSEVTRKAEDMKKFVLQRRSKMVAHKNMTELYKNFTDHKLFKDMVLLVKYRTEKDENIKSPHPNTEFNHRLKFNIDTQAVSEIQIKLSRFADVSLSQVGQVSEDQVPVDVQSKGSAIVQRQIDQRQRFDPLTMTPSRGVRVDVRVPGDRESPDIRCLVTGPSLENLFAVDTKNKTIKVFSLRSYHFVSSLSLDMAPVVLTCVSDRQFAVTSEQKVIIVIDANDISRMKVERHVVTSRQYSGLAAVATHNNDIALLASCYRDSAGPANVDLITLTGARVRTVISSDTLPTLRWPGYLHADTQRDVLFISDWGSHCVFQVQLSSGIFQDQFEFPQMSSPSQLCTDSAGHLYVASVGCQCVLLKSVEDFWRVLLTGRPHGDGNHVCPSGLCLTDTGLVVSWNGGVVKRYDFI